VLAGFLARYCGQIREACTLDLRQFTTWCRTHVQFLGITTGVLYRLAHRGILGSSLSRAGFVATSRS
jgi:hypothetical protein